MSGIMYDETANNHDGTINGALIQGNTLSSNSMVFDGTNFLTFDESPQLKTQTHTVCLWINTSFSGATQSIFTNWRRVDGINYGYLFQLNATGFLVATAEGGTGNTSNVDRMFIKSSVAVNTGSPVHVGFTYNGSDLQLYINGQPDNSISSGPLTYTGTIGYTTGMFATLGTRSSGTSVNDQYGYYPHIMFKGEMDEFKIFDRALSSQEMLDTFNEHSSALIP